MASNFDTSIQELKYKVLKEVIKSAWDGTLEKDFYDIPKKIIPGKEPIFRCCVYKERAVLEERVKIAMGLDKEHIIKTIEIACDECPTAGYEVTDFCRGCIGHMCLKSCHFDAITIGPDHHSHIDKTKCKNCGMCAKACPYNAIVNRKRPCQMACHQDAIEMNEDMSVKINYDNCISCGACVYKCPFGALQDTSYVVDIVKLLKNKKNKDYKIFAIVAPAIASQFTYAHLGQIVTGLKKLGFDEVLEAALGADMVSKNEAKEFAEKGFLVSSCCPAFVKRIETKFPSIKDSISSSLSPMATLAKYIKTKHKGEKIKIVFIGPCTAKKAEIKRDEVKKYVDFVMTFEELQAMFDAKELDVNSLPENKIYNASYFGRKFAVCGGLSESLAEGLKELGEDVQVNPLSCDGIEECNKALLLRSKNLLGYNFVEGMACVGGCVNGAGSLKHDPKNKDLIENYGKASKVETIIEAINSAKV